MLFTPAFRNMDSTLEEASLVSGAGVLRTLRLIVVPIMTPIVGVVLLLAVVHSLQAFELALILGFPIRFYVFSTQIHWLLNQQPPQFSSATALSSVILFIMVPLIILQRRAVARRDYATVGGRYQLGQMDMADVVLSARGGALDYGCSALILDARLFHGSLRLF
jgi:iron(III) transport system permease protein